jgi:hypothetical protein
MKTEYEDWFQDLRTKRTIKALQKNNFDVRFSAGPKEALEEIFGMIPEGASVGVGGSVTLTQIGFLQEVQKRPVTFLNPGAQGLSPEAALEVRRKILLADVFVCSSNAVTEDGKLYNVDATGNRVAAMMFGPKKVIVVCGTNKIVRDMEEARARVRNWTAPMNVKRLGYKNPCAETGECMDCSSPQRICNIYAELGKKPTRTDFTVVLIGETLGL